MKEKKEKPQLNIIKITQEFIDNWKKVDEDTKGLITNDTTKLTALIMVFVISFFVTTFIPQISREFSSALMSISFFYILFILQTFISIIYGFPYIPIDNPILLLVNLLLLYLLLMISMSFIGGNYGMITNFAFFGYAMLISALCIVAFIILSGWISHVFPIRRTKTQNFMKLVTETMGISIGLFIMIYYLPFDIILPYNLFLKYSNISVSFDSILNPQNLLVTMLTAIGADISGHILLRIFVIFFICYALILINDTLFVLYRKLRGIQLIKAEPYIEYEEK